MKNEEIEKKTRPRLKEMLAYLLRRKVLVHRNKKKYYRKDKKKIEKDND